MAITFTKKPSGIYPVFNDCWLEFTSDLANVEYCEITIQSNQFFRPFLVYADSDGVFRQNLKEIALSQMALGFEDNGLGVSDPGSSFDNDKIINLVFQFAEVSGVTTVLSTGEYSFVKSSVQVVDSFDFSEAKIMLWSDSFKLWNITYFEGFPHFFTIDRFNLDESSQVSIYNTRTGIESDPIPITDLQSFRFLVDDGSGNNFRTCNYMHLINGMNHLNINISGRASLSLNIKKVSLDCGVCLKWFNDKGDYSFFVFNRAYNYDLRSEELGYVSRNDFLNVGSQRSKRVSSGRIGGEEISLFTVADGYEVEYLKSLFVSPYVQMWTGEKANEGGKFVDVGISGILSFNNKKLKNRVNLTIELPELVTAKI